MIILRQANQQGKQVQVEVNKIITSKLHRKSVSTAVSSSIESKTKASAVLANLTAKYSQPYQKEENTHSISKKAGITINNPTENISLDYTWDE